MAKKEYTFEELSRDIVQKKFSPVYFFMGEEPFFMDKLTDLLINNVLSEEEKDFNQLVFYGADAEASAIINAARRFPMMSKYQLIVVREAQLIKDIEELNHYVQNPLQSTVLVVNYKYKNLDRRRALAGSVDKTGILFESKKVADYKMPAFIGSMLQQQNIAIDAKASQMLADFLGNDLSRLTKELDKLSLLLPGNLPKKITPELVEQNIGISKEFNNFELIKALVAKGTYFFDYGNAFMRAVFDSGVKEISKNGVDTYEGFIFPSYVEDIMGPLLFDYGYGPFRWCCLTRDPEDLRKTDRAAMDCIDPTRRFQDHDNWVWIRDAEKNKLVVGTQCRILYQDEEGRMKIALKFNEMVRTGEIGPVMLGRDHHDVSGTDSPFRETSNIKDGSNIMAEMAIHCFAGNCARGMSLVALHNGGGVGTGKSINGGFGLVLDGSERVDRIIKESMSWDVISGVARRAWARNEHAIETVNTFNAKRSDGHITVPFIADEAYLAKLVADNK